MTGSASDQQPTFAAGLSAHPDPAEAVAEVVVQVTERLPGPPSVAVVFAAGTSIDALDDVVGAVDSLLCPDQLIGATAVGVLGGGEEIESGNGLALWAATGVPTTPVRLESLGGSPPIVVGVPEPGRDGGVEPGSVLVTLADPYTFPVDALVDQLNEAPTDTRLAVVGGLASAPGGPEQNRLVLGSEVVSEGAVGLVLPPGLATPVVSQGCRPIGSPWVVTEASGQLVHQLGGRVALERVNELIESLADEDRRSAARGLHVGIVADEQQATFGQGDFLIRGLLGADKETGAVAIGDRADVGQVLQFQVRDEASASQELDRLLAPVSGRGALVFTCNGRGSHLFTEPSHDAARVSETLGPAVAGMFCAGELGPIAGRNALHGFTATVLAFH